VSIQIVGQCPICGAHLYTYPTYPADFKVIHTQCNCYEITTFYFTDYYSSLKNFAEEEEENE